ncbi:MAG: FAD-dependent oxidoreductase [Spirochaetes bacterium]|nr:FAD-dependent oxidoreductase [Spirochaetota bacterium]
MTGIQSRKKIVVIGGSAAGPKAAARARRLDQNAEITIIQKDPDLSMASCGYPYYVGGFFDDRRLLIGTSGGTVRDADYYMNMKDIAARTGTEAIAIDRGKRAITCRDLATGTVDEVPYDSLVITTGARPVIPPVPGADLEGITTLQSMRDADYLRRVRDEKKIKRAVVIGGGLIGIETCEALQNAGIAITVIEMMPQLLAFLDWELAKLVEHHVIENSSMVITENGLAAFAGEKGKLVGVRLSDGTELPCELAVVAVGVRPSTALAQEAGLLIGETGGIAVNEYMQTSDPCIYAAGDCVEIPHLITGRKVHAPYGDLANLQGRVAGENAALGNRATFPGTIQTGICKVFEYTAGSTGLSERAARAAGFEDVVTVICAGADRPGFMEGELLVTKLAADAKSGRILGAQCVGPGDASKQLAIWAMAILAGRTVGEIVNADLPYAPPFSTAIDHSIAATHVMQNKIEGRFRGISAAAVRERLDRGERPFLLDVRGPDEYAETRLGIGEKLVPLETLRRRLGELPADKDAEIICYCAVSLRGYEASLILGAHGWTNVHVMEGGIAAWPYAKEK